MRRESPEKREFLIDIQHLKCEQMGPGACNQVRAQFFLFLRNEWRAKSQGYILTVQALQCYDELRKKHGRDHIERNAETS